jgi:AcrR family transcriptional regulator
LSTAVEKNEFHGSTTAQALQGRPRTAFAELGFDGATIRDVARRADVDPALVIRYFGSKDALFARATRFDLQLPDLADVAPRLLGTTLAGHFFDLWENPNSGDAMKILLRSAASSAEAAATMRTIFTQQVEPALRRVAPSADAATRAALVSSQLLGFALCRYVLQLPPIVAMTRADVIRALGRTLNGYLSASHRV